MLVGFRADSVEILDERGRHAATLPRSRPGSGETVFDPATLISAVTARPRLWGQSLLRKAVPPALWEGMDRYGSEERHQTLRALLRASEACGFEVAANAAARIFESGRIPDHDSLDVLARHMSGEGLEGAADLSVYDGLLEEGEGG